MISKSSNAWTDRKVNEHRNKENVGDYFYNSLIKEVLAIIPKANAKKSGPLKVQAK
jgi:hypothetical protein